MAPAVRAALVEVVKERRGQVAGNMKTRKLVNDLIEAGNTYTGGDASECKSTPAPWTQ